jgi:serine/threonine protein kinase
VSESLDRLESLFAAALQQPPADRAAFLEEACGGPAVRRRLEALLRAQAAAGSFLEVPAVAPCATVDAAPAAERRGTAVGPYKLVEQIGEGGMGSVWLAQQTEPVKRLVALKLIKAGLDSGQVVARFEAERQVLALMDHPNIARVLDGGTTDAGRPYFVMEVVKGAPITNYCDEYRLTPRQRLELFVNVCHAVQHAHQKGIIHRDLKPSNVLLALYDGRPVPKVIDFGVAKAAGPTLTDKPVLKLAEKALAAEPRDYDRLLAVGAVLYRAGRFKEAAQRLTEADAAFPQAKSPRCSLLYTWLFQAMTQHRLGRSDEARKLLGKTEKAAKRSPPEAGTSIALNRRLTLRLLRREAEALLKK